MGRERRHAHRHDGPLRRRERSDRAQELVGPRPVHHAQDGVAALGQAERPLATVLGFLVALDESTPDEAVDEPARRRWRPADLLGQLADGHRAPVGQHVQRRELGEAESQLAELAGEPDDQLAPEGAAHRHALADLADVREAVAGGQDRRGQVRLESAGDGLARDDATADGDRLFGHPQKRRTTATSMQPCTRIGPIAAAARATLNDDDVIRLRVPRPGLAVGRDGSRAGRAVAGAPRDLRGGRRRAR